MSGGMAGATGSRIDRLGRWATDVGRSYRTAIRRKSVVTMSYVCASTLVLLIAGILEAFTKADWVYVLMMPMVVCWVLMLGLGIERTVKVVFSRSRLPVAQMSKSSESSGMSETKVYPVSGWRAFTAGAKTLLYGYGVYVLLLFGADQLTPAMVKQVDRTTEATSEVAIPVLGLLLGFPASVLTNAYNFLASFPNTGVLLIYLAVLGLVSVRYILPVADDFHYAHQRLLEYACENWNFFRKGDVSEETSDVVFIVAVVPFVYYIGTVLVLLVASAFGSFVG